MRSTRLELVVDGDDIDSLGHVNNAAFVRMLERGRIDFYRRIGLALEAPEPPRLGTLVVNLNVDFRAECFAGDRLCLDTRPGRLGRTSFTLQQMLVRADDGREAVTATVTCVVMDLDTRRVVAVPAVLRDAFLHA